MGQLLSQFLNPFSIGNQPLGIIPRDCFVQPVISLIPLFAPLGQQRRDLTRQPSTFKAFAGNRFESSNQSLMITAPFALWEWRRFGTVVTDTERQMISGIVATADRSTQTDLIDAVQVLSRLLEKIDGFNTHAASRRVIIIFSIGQD